MNANKKPLLVELGATGAGRPDDVDESSGTGKSSLKCESGDTGALSVIATVIVTRDGGESDDASAGGRLSVTRTGLRYDSVSSETSAELYATAYTPRSTDYESSIEDTDALCTAVDWDEESDLDTSINLQVPTIIIDGIQSSSESSDAAVGSVDNIQKRVSSDCEENLPSQGHLTDDAEIYLESTRSLHDQIQLEDSISDSVQTGEDEGTLTNLPAEPISEQTPLPSQEDASAGIYLESTRSVHDQNQFVHSTSGSLQTGEDEGNPADLPADPISEQKPLSSQENVSISVPQSGWSSVCAGHSPQPEEIYREAATEPGSPRIIQPEVQPQTSLISSALNISRCSSNDSTGHSSSQKVAADNTERAQDTVSDAGSADNTTKQCTDVRIDLETNQNQLKHTANVLICDITVSVENEEVVPNTLSLVSSHGKSKALNNIKDKMASRRRRDGQGEQQDGAEEGLIHGQERRDSEASYHYELKGDEWNIALLLGLYLLQGIPLGLSSAIPMIIQNKGVSFKQQAEFSFTIWPFSLKLLWAPLVDALFYPSFGRRKTWLVPAQYLIGFFMIFLSVNIDGWLNSDEPQITFLTLLFFAMNFLAATQDIAVDGWALTMLKRQNKSLASMCNSVGQTAGYFLGYVVFLALESASFCNSYLRTEPEDTGLVTLPGFLYFWGFVYLFMTTLVAFIKRENREPGLDRPSVSSALGSYHLLLRILKLPNIQLIAFILLTVKIGFAAFDGVTSLKLIEKGVPKDKLAILAVPLVPMQILLPIIVTKYNHPRRPMDLFLKAYPYRLAFNIIGGILVFLTPLVISGTKDIPYYFYILMICMMGMHQVATVTMFVQQMAFFATVSDADAGGTYMTLLNTLANLGGTWTATTALAVVDSLTYRNCMGSNTTETNTCSTPHLKTECEATGGKCVTDIDGYYVELALLTVIGVVWYWFGRKKINQLQTRPLSSWAVPRR